VAAAGGAIAAQVVLPFAPAGDLLPAVGTAARVTVLVGAAVALTSAGIDVVRGGRAASPPWSVILVAAVLLALLLIRHPGRLILNEAGFVFVAVPLAWVVARRAGRGTATMAVLAVAALALSATFADVRRPLATVESLPDSPFRWAAGWPEDGWVLRHEIALDAPAPAVPVVLTAPLARDYAGPAQVLTRVNGHDLGPAKIDGHLLTIDLPQTAVAGQTRFTIELRTTRPDPNLRLLAFRVTRGATLGSQASSYFDPETQRWLPGTFNDAIGRPQPGIYLIELSERTL
jgi:hypothetical protein